MTQGAKGNPAHVRAANPRKKAARAASWNRGEARKVKRRAEGEFARVRNLGTVAGGGLTPWQTACAARAARRADLATAWAYYAGQLRLPPSGSIPPTA